MQPQTDVAKIVTEPRQHYACTDCPARCCRRPWQIRVTPEEHARYLSTPWVKEYLEEKKAHFVEKDGFYVVPVATQPDGGQGCVFLNEQNQCVMHSNEGHGFIPLTCQQYPFSLLEEPSGELRLLNSFACRSIMHDYGDSLASTGPAKAEEILKTVIPAKLPESVEAGGIRLSRAVYLALCTEMEQFFTPEQSVPEALAQCRALAWETVTQLGEDATPEKIAPLAAKIRQTSYAEPLAQASGNPLTVNTLVSMHLLPYFVEHWGRANSMDKPLGEVSRWTFIQLFLSLFLNKGEHPFWGLPKPISLEAASRVSLNMAGDAFQAHLRRYFVHLFFTRKAVTVTPDLLKSLFTLGIAYSAIAKVSQYHAYAHNRSAVTEEDLLEGMSLVDALVSSSMPAAGAGLNKLKETILDLLSVQESTFYRLLKG